MRVTKEDLKLYGLFDKLPQELKTLPADQFFVFYYDVDEQNMRLKVYEYSNQAEVNVSLYRGLNKIAIKNNSLTINIGFFKNTFDTRDGLFYQFIRTYNDDTEAISAFYSYAIAQDRICDISISTNAISSIYTSDDFRNAISYFCPLRLQSIMFVYDMVNEVFERRLSKSLYGQSIKKVVNLIKFDGGVLPEFNGTLRFMVIGENANLSEEQKDKLKEAKLFLRSLQKLEDIYITTGWAFSDTDGKWRTNIADDEAGIDKTFLYDYNGRKLYVPNGGTEQQVLSIIDSPKKLYGLNYKGKLSDVLKHPTLYKYYPKLAILPLIYYYGDKKDNRPSFYFSPNQRGGFININGYKECGDSLSILLHEIQHYVQHIEGYATGGNLFLASFVAAVGGASVRKIFSCINRMERIFRDEFYSEEGRIELLEAVKKQLASSKSSQSLKNTLVEYLSNSQEYFDNYKTINFYLVLFVADNGRYISNNVTILFQNKLGEESGIIYELFETISEGYNSANNYKEKIASEGYRQEDIDKILFKSYENLYGEMESRSVQSSRLVGSEYKNYFYLTRWENAPLQQISVIDGIEIIIDSAKIKAAVETKGDEYVIHFEKSNTCLPFLHELGHIVHDALNTLGYKEKIKDCFSENYNFDNIDEYFVSRFLGYIKEKVGDANIYKDFRLDFSISSDKRINEILDEFFADTEVNERLKYLQTILSLI